MKCIERNRKSGFTVPEVRGTRILGLRSFVLVVVVVLAATACGDDGIPDLEAPVGEQVLPDLVPVPPEDLRVTFKDDGSAEIKFSSTVANIGGGDFVLRANEVFDQWTVDQEIHYSESGGILQDIDAEVIWGGDGHEHWHISRVATYQLFAMNADDSLTRLDRFDTKVGFCFFDHTRVQDSGPESFVYHVEECGTEGDQEIRMGLSSGWSDVYDFGLPGQSIDITGLEDGKYRVEATADEAAWFAEADVSNNTTWVDFELQTMDGRPFATVVAVGPDPR